ncbi:hypothetical protein EC973_002325 [Apophysomyces ossiformis]|uniref:F-box domain-containing protein n=1 Tax=Apophysomyces ossiformis TaxID=679940 RepID=A0A8H7BIH8_9FUNG|nr:hypothetical protein EC973_002325 [Apophysomyces ossiformis]
MSRNERCKSAEPVSMSISHTQQLPPEIVELIAKNLSTKDQYECLRVCKDWYKEFRRALYRAVYIRTRWQFKALYRSLLLTQERQDPLGHLIREFKLNHKLGMSVKEMHCLPILCPFLVAIDSNWRMWRHLPDQSRALKLFKNIKRFSALKYCNDARAILEAHADRLTHLHLRHRVLTRWQGLEFPAIALIRAKNLTHLELSGITEDFYDENRHITISTSDLEVINFLCENLRHLALTRVRLVYKEHTLRGTANKEREGLHLRSLSLDNCKMDCAEWIVYLANNYRKLESLYWSLDFNNPALSDEPALAEKGLLLLAQNATKLRKLTFRCMLGQCWPGAAFFTTLKQNGALLEDISLDFWTYPEPTIMDMATFDAMIRTCSKNLRALKMDLWLGLEKEIEFILQPLSAFPILKLDLVGSGDVDNYLHTDLEIDVILDCLAYLKDLKITRIALKIRNRHITENHGLLSLALNLVGIRPELIEYVAHRCPRLKNLGIHNSTWAQPYGDLSTRMKLDMPNHIFEKVDIARLNLGFPMDDGSLRRFSGSAVLALTQLEKIKHICQRRNIQTEKSKLTRWYHLHNMDEFNPISKALRRLGDREILAMTGYQLLPDDLDAFDDSSISLTYKKWDQWWMDIPFGYIDLTCRSIEEVRFDTCIIK